MAHITITNPQGEQFYIEGDGNKLKALILKETSKKSLIDLLKENEEAVVRALFISDCESRRAKEIAADLGLTQQTVIMWKHEAVKGREMITRKFQTLKKLYNIDSILN